MGKKWYEQQAGPDIEPGVGAKSEVTPSILQHPNLPKPMHGLNPRTLMGQKWWDEKRHAAYAERGFHCWACGVHKSEARVHQWLEGHEEYDIDYPRGRMVFRRVVALCSLCHGFIHSGRLYMIHFKGEITDAQFKAVIVHGFNVLQEADLLPWSGTLESVLLAAEENDWNGIRGYSVAKMRKMLSEAKANEGDLGESADWGDWRLVLEGKEHPPIHGSMEEWSKAYGS
jgi:hypothetical protein